MKQKPDLSSAPKEERVSFLARGLLLKPISLFALCLVILCSVALAYVGGVMSGRKSAECEHQEKLVAKNEVNPSCLPVSPQTQALLLPQELEFSRLLRNENRLQQGQVRLQSKNDPQKMLPNQEKEPSLAVSQKENVKDAQIGQSPSVPPSEVRQDSPLQAHTEIGAGAGELPPLYDFVLQVAAVKSEDGADALRQRLEGHGLRTFLKREGKLFLIQVRFRGDEARSKELMAILQDLHLGRPMVISQKQALR